MTGDAPGPDPLGATWERMIRGVEKARDRPRRASAALQAANIPHVIAGEHAASFWVARADEAATRNAVGTDIIIRRADLEAARNALGTAGFMTGDYAETIEFFNARDARPCDAVRLLFASEKARPDDALPVPDVDESVPAAGFPVLSLEPLVRSLLTSHRILDRVLVRDLIDMGLVDDSWLARLPDPLRPRLGALLDSPDG